MKIDGKLLGVIIIICGVVFGVVVDVESKLWSLSAFIILIGIIIGIIFPLHDLIDEKTVEKIKEDYGWFKIGCRYTRDMISRKFTSENGDINITKKEWLEFIRIDEKVSTEVIKDLEESLIKND